MGLQLQNCCFCVDLRTGSLIIGYMNLVGMILCTLMSIITLIGAALYKGLNKPFDRKSEAEEKSLEIYIFTVMSVVVAIMILNLICTIVLLVGLHKYKRGHVKAYLIYNAIFIVISFILFIVNIVFGTPLTNIVRDLITLLVTIYFLQVIGSYYKKMGDPEKKPVVYNTA